MTSGLHIINEEWRAIPGYEGSYEISNTGKARSLDRESICGNGQVRHLKGRELRTHRTGNGYPGVDLNMVGKKKVTIPIHRLVALVFIPNPNGYRCVDHIDGNKNNNLVSNLRWVTHKENSNNPITLQMYRENIKRGKEHHCFGKKWSEEAIARRIETARKHGTLSRPSGKNSARSKAVNQYSLDGTLIRRWDCIEEASKTLGIDRCTIYNSCVGKYRGRTFIWRYADKED